MSAQGRRSISGLNKRKFLKNWRSAAILVSGMILILMAHMLVVGPIIGENDDMAGKIEKQEELIEKYRIKISEAEQNSGRLEGLGERSRLAKYIADGATPAQVAAKIDSLLSSLEEKGIKKVSFQPLDPGRYGGIKEANMKCALTGDVRGFYHLFKALEDYPRPIRVKECIIRVLNKRPSQMDPMTMVLTFSTIIGIEKEG